MAGKNQPGRMTGNHLADCCFIFLLVGKVYVPLLNAFFFSKPNPDEMRLLKLFNLISAPAFHEVKLDYSCSLFETGGSTAGKNPANGPNFKQWAAVF